jgi:L-alanine-DL-glutamate epimerase-like enolase superfamily enzyme
MSKLTDLSKFGVQSIEQPLKPGDPTLERICRDSPIPIALDEELIGVERLTDKVSLLERIKPSYIVLKPTLHGGFRGCSEWIALAENLGVGWWVTSALESNVGLNAICQYTAQYSVAIPQGLGTGKLYNNNFSCPLRMNGGTIYRDPSVGWEPIGL